MSEDFAKYIVYGILFLCLLKLFRYEKLSRHLFIVYLIFLVSPVILIPSLLLAIAVDYSLHIKLLFHHLIMIAIITSVLFACLYYKENPMSLIRAFLERIKTEVDESTTQYEYKSTEFYLENDLENNLSKIYTELKRDIENNFFYSLGLFALISILIYNVFANQYDNLFEPLWFYGILPSSKWNLVWIIPSTFIITYLYSRYFYPKLTKVIFIKFHMISRLLESKGRVVIVDDWKDLRIVDESDIEERYLVSREINTVLIKNKIYLQINEHINLENYCKILNNYEIRVRIFSKEFYRDFVDEE